MVCYKTNRDMLRIFGTLFSTQALPGTPGYNWARSKRGQLWKFTDGVWGLLHGVKRWSCSQILWKKNCVYLRPIWFEIYVVSTWSKFAVKVDFSSGGCQKLPSWVKITDQNVDMLQLVRKIFYSKSWRKKITTYFTVLCNYKCIWA